MIRRESVLPWRRVLILAGSLILTGLLSDCGKRSEPDSAPVTIVDVKTDFVRSGEIDETIMVSGSTQYRIEAQIRSPIGGLITHFKLFNGDRVKKGEVVAQVRPKESQAAISGAEQLLRAATTAAQHEEAQKALDLALKTANTVAIPAPSHGIFSDKVKNEQEVVAEGELIATIVDPSSLIFLAQAPTSSISRIQIGQQVAMKFTTRPGRVYAGVVHRIQPEVNPGDQSIPVQVAFATPNPDIEGSLFGEATITIGQHKSVLVVPRQALLRDDENNSTSLMIVGSDSLAHKIQVRTGLSSDTAVEVSSPGLTAGSLVITEGQYGLPDSTRVRIQR